MKKSDVIYDLGQINLYFKPMIFYQSKQDENIIIVAQNQVQYKLGRLSF